ncbi:lysophospholipase L1-like esterase [Streptacidiphilus sp. MAP12-16]|uniref:SGNH/GDSL hydrolase family protein n=1 Tax=Streptacidiphilus sp. MAP12-16 TaxID=3156300 RepID=UPI0035189CF9
MLSHAPRRPLALIAGLALAASVTVLTAPSAHAAGDPGQFVALGDSYAAAAGVPDQYAGLCLRSDHNYGHLLAAALNVTAYTDATCAAAKIKDITGAQTDAGIRVNDPQLNAVSADTRLITLGIGGNDLGSSDLGIGDVIATCIAGAVVNPSGTPCHDVYAHGHWTWSNWSWTWAYGNDTLVDRINAAAPNLAGTLQQIRAKAPQARILVLGYPALLPDDSRTCAGRLPVTVGDVTYLRGILADLNTMIATTAAANGASYVDTLTPPRGHDACSADPWIEGALPSQPAVPFHPNATGEQVMADAVLAAVNS